MMHYSLDEIFAYMAQRKLEVSVYGRTQTSTLKYFVSISLGYDMHVSSYGKQRIAVDGVGKDFWEALNSAYQQLMNLVEILEAKPEPEEPPRMTASDDDIPF